MLNPKVKVENLLDPSTKQVSAVGGQHHQYYPKVLFVDDDPIVQFIHKRMFLKLRCLVDVAKSATEALKMVHQEYDLLFLDIGLPDLSGIELIHEIAKQGKITPKTRIIILTICKDEKMLKECFLAGAEQVIYKPIGIEELKQVVFQPQT